MSLVESAYSEIATKSCTQYHFTFRQKILLDLSRAVVAWPLAVIADSTAQPPLHFVKCNTLAIMRQVSGRLIVRPADLSHFDHAAACDNLSQHPAAG
jgi:hypothetical protein